MKTEIETLTMKIEELSEDLDSANQQKQELLVKYELLQQENNQLKQDLKKTLEVP